MRIYVSFYGNLIRFKACRNEKESPLNIDEGKTIGDLIKLIGIPEPELSVICCNNQIKPITYRLQAEDRIQLYSLLSGG